MNVTVVGRGKVGRALARALRSTSAEVRTFAGRGAPTPVLGLADVVLLCVPDARIVEVAARIAPFVRRGATVLHVAGARSHEELATLRSGGVHVAAMHPMVSFAPDATLPGFAGTTFVIGGDPRAERAGARVARLLGARPVIARVQGPTYHAAAALAANGAVGLANAAVKLLVDLGLGRRDAEHAIGGLLGTVAHNVRSVGVPTALTGPIVRGDAATVESHRRLLAERSSEALAAYDGAAISTLACALDAGLSRRDARAIEAALRVDVTPPRRRRPTRPR